MRLGTVKAHVTRVLMKLELDNRVQVALLAHDAGLAERHSWQVRFAFRRSSA